MTLTELVAAVYVQTNKPYMVAETLQAVKASTLKLHCIDFFAKDLQAAQVRFDFSAYIQQLDTSALPFYRSMGVFRKNDPTYAAYQQDPTLLPPISNPAITPNSVMGFIEVITPDAIFDEFGVERMNVGYQAGGTFNIKSDTSFQYALMNYYRYPDVQDATYTSWIATEFPYAIVFDAASSIFQSVGENDASRKYDSPGGLAYEARMSLQNSNVVAKGY